MAKSTPDERCDVCSSVLLNGRCPTIEDHEVPSPAKTRREESERKLAAAVENLGDLPKRLRQIYDLFRAKGIDLADLEDANIKRVNFWQQGQKNAEGEPNILDLAGIELSPGWESGPKWPVVGPAKAVKFQALRTTSKKPSDRKTAVVLPDMQIGYFHTGDIRNPKLEPIHDERAIEIALTIIREQQPEQIIFLGDNLDLAEFGKYRQYRAFQGTVQPTLDRAGALVAEVRALSPNSQMVWLEGNHEVRLTNFIIDNGGAAYGLRKAGQTFRDIPVLAVPNLLHFEEYGVEYISGYPAGEHRIMKWLSCIHGKYVRSDSPTASVYLRKGWDSVIFGHVHRIERVDQTRQSYKGPRTKTAASPGCLCRIDGVVPSTLGGVDIFGRPVFSAENWQQGLMVVDYEDDRWYSLDQVTIWSGRAMWRGKAYDSTVKDTYIHPSVQ